MGSRIPPKTRRSGQPRINPPSATAISGWIFAPDPRGKTGQDIYAARGRFGQYIIVVPEHDMVVVVYAMSVPESGQDRTTELLYDRILTAVRR